MGREIDQYLDWVLTLEHLRKTKGLPIDLSYFLERSSPEPNSGCWIWMHARNWKGYGVIRTGGKTVRAHRVAYECATGKRAPQQADVCHRCDNPTCVNPGHLFVGSRSDNMKDCSAKGRLLTPFLKGEECPASKLTAEQVRSIRRDNRSQRKIASTYGVDKGTIAHIKNGKTWRSVV